MATSTARSNKPPGQLGYLYPYLPIRMKATDKSHKYGKLTCNSGNGCHGLWQAYYFPPPPNSPSTRQLFFKFQTGDEADDLITEAYTTNIVADTAKQHGVHEHFMEYIGAGMTPMKTMLGIPVIFDPYNDGNGNNMKETRSLVLLCIEGAQSMQAVMHTLTFADVEKLFSSIHVLWKTTGFIHNDLHTSNIILDASKKLVAIDYGRSWVRAIADIEQLTRFGRSIDPVFQIPEVNEFMKTASPQGGCLQCHMTDLAGMMLSIIIECPTLCRDLWPVSYSYDRHLICISSKCRITMKGDMIDKAVLWLWALLHTFRQNKIVSAKQTIQMPDGSSEFLIDCEKIIGDEHQPFFVGGQLMPVFFRHEKLNRCMQGVLISDGLSDLLTEIFGTAQTGGLKPPATKNKVSSIPNTRAEPNLNTGIAKRVNRTPTREYSIQTTKVWKDRLDAIYETTNNKTIVGGGKTYNAISPRLRVTSNRSTRARHVIHNGKRVFLKDLLKSQYRFMGRQNIILLSAEPGSQTRKRGR